MGRFDESLSAAQRADEIAPSVNNDILRARTYYFTRRFDEAADYCRRSLKKSDNVLGHFYLGFISVAQQKYDAAIAEFKIGADFSNNGGALAGLAYGYAMTGRKDEALKIIDELISRSGASHDLP